LQNTQPGEAVIHKIQLVTPSLEDVFIALLEDRSPDPGKLPHEGTFAKE